jgi:sigma-B regulation protein RsbU (phosphoserine phosphatase)
MSNEPSSPPSGPPGAVAPARLLVADDDVLNRQVLQRRLEAEGFQVVTAVDGREALEALRREAFDLVLLDFAMPVLGGDEVLRLMKADERLRELPVIMIAPLDELDCVAKCIEHGADDYLPKPYKPVLLRARIKSCLEKKRLREQEQATYRALVVSQQHLAAELAEAAQYVRSLLPEPLTDGPVRTEWRFLTSTSLGGDSFGYHWLDDDHLAMYLLDVCGHGVGAALLSISAMNVLRSHALPDTDFRDPGAVLGGLNEAFQMERHNNMYFTIWYGVFNRRTREIVHARGGDSRETAQTVELKTPGLVIGSMSGVRYKTAVQPLGAFAELFLFSDGVYEIRLGDGEMWEFGEFVSMLTQTPPAGTSAIDVVMRRAQALQGTETFEDDFSMVKFGL